MALTEVLYPARFLALSGRLVGDTLYGIQKEYARAVLVAGAGLMFDSLRAVLNGQTVGRRPERTQILQAAVAGVLLAYGSGRDFGRRVRQWRLLADVANDAGLALQMAAPFYGDHFVPLACLAAACHCAYGVMAGATKASISRHFACRGNFEELVAKEGSRERAVHVLGLILGYYVLAVLNDSPKTVVAAFAVLTLLRALANVLAVRQLRFRTINEPVCARRPSHTPSTRRLVVTRDRGDAVWGGSRRSW